MSSPSRKLSTTSSLSSYGPDKPAQADPESQETQSYPAAYYATYCHAGDSPHSAVYVATRYLIVAVAIAEITLSIVAQRAIDRDRWMSPILSPAITSATSSLVDLYYIKRHCRRAGIISRFYYDGAIAIGFAIASGFLVSFTLGDIARSRADSTSATAGVGTAILFTMFSSM